MSSRLIAVSSQKGGVGKTTIAVNLAAAAASELGADVALVQLEVPFSGDSTVMLGGERGATLATLASEIPNLTGDMFAERLVRHSSGIVLVPASLDLATAAEVTLEVVSDALEMLMRVYPCVVADIGAGTDELALEVYDRASAVLVVTCPDLLDVNRARQTRDYVQTLLYPGDRIHVVLNKQHKKQRVPRRILELNLRQPVAFEIPEATTALEDASMRGAPLVTIDPRHAVSRAFFAIVNALFGTPPLPDGAKLGIQKSQTEATQKPAAKAAPRTPPTESPAPASDSVRQHLMSDEILDLKRRVHTRIVSEMNLHDLDYRTMKKGRKARELRVRVEQMVARLLDDEAAHIADKGDRAVLSRDILNEALGFGPLEYLLGDDRVSEVMVNGPDTIFIEKDGRITSAGYRFTGEEQLRTVIERIVVEVGRRIDENSPMVDARLHDGSRVNAVIPPLALDGSVLTIRKFSKKPLQIVDLVRFGSLTEQMAEFLRVCVQARKNILISGGTGSGKTTLLNVLSGFIPADERIVTIEDSAELQLPQEHVVRLETRPPNVEGRGQVEIRDLVRNSLRMRPDRIVVGECRGGEALDMLQAMNTGHDGSLTTVHANNPRDALSRLETMSMMSGIELPSKAIRDQITAAIDVVVQQSRLRDGSRKIMAITELTGMEGNVFTMQDIFVFRQSGMDGQRVQGNYGPTGLIPSFLDDLVEQGFEVPREIFIHQMA